MELGGNRVNLGETGWIWEELGGSGRNWVGTGRKPGESGRNWVDLGGNQVNLGGTEWNWVGTGRNLGGTGRK